MCPCAWWCPAPGLEEASRQYFGESNVEAMLATLLPLHDMLERGPPATLKEIAFLQSYGREVRGRGDGRGGG